MSISNKNYNFPNNLAQDQKIAGIYHEINSELLKLLQNDTISPKPLMVCGGGTSSRCTSEGHWTIDLRKNYQQLEFDKKNNEVVIESGINMEKLLKSLIEFNRSFPIGLSGITGIGYILTGGISPLSRKYGLAIDQILEISGYWGNGDKFHLYKPDLLSNESHILQWKALCGAAPFFAIITKIRLKTQKLNPLTIWETSLSPIQLAEIIEKAEEWPKSASLHWIWGNKIKCYGTYECDEKDKSNDLNKIINEIPKGGDFLISKIPNLLNLPQLNSHGNQLFNQRSYSEVIGLLGPSISTNSYDLIKRIKSLMKDRQNEYSYIAAQQLGGATTHEENNLSSFIHRDAIWKPWISGSWNSRDKKGQEQSLKWMEQVWDELYTYFPGVHLAQIHPHLSWHKKEIKAAFKNWLPKLQQLKSKYDPKGNLPPL
ncbi:FAD-binding protein [Prochlorococcus marinus]|uniref:FAD-binding protein n=1 Tax=Prochlorococcus marinus TaxID=1219 RepID=UPI0022B4AE62|nr:FAD-binding protein [Prochlorococcus marinus]